MISYVIKSYGMNLETVKLHVTTCDKKAPLLPQYACSFHVLTQGLNLVWNWPVGFGIDKI